MLTGTLPIQQAFNGFDKILIPKTLQLQSFFLKLKRSTALKHRFPGKYILILLLCAAFSACGKAEPPAPELHTIADLAAFRRNKRTL